MKNYIINNLLKKQLIRILVFSHLLSLLILTACTSSLGKKGEWNATYKTEFVSNCKAEIQKEESLLKIDSLTISKICDCVVSKAEKEFAPLKMEEKNALTQMKTISTDCARDILIEKLNKK
ncbi:hypothetical protein ACE193_00780 [Bernardetia sp. OM2101]|uniref:hypothetical protein n=1 Tax=Bernardetia sp. OM2101 TaxID=3344876 RepID=UPI0035D00AAF